MSQMRRGPELPYFFSPGLSGDGLELQESHSSYNNHHHSFTNNNSNSNSSSSNHHNNTIVNSINISNNISNNTSNSNNSVNLVDGIPEEDRAALFPIIKLAFPSLTCSDIESSCMKKQLQKQRKDLESNSCESAANVVVVGSNDGNVRATWPGEGSRGIEEEEAMGGEGKGGEVIMVPTLHPRNDADDGFFGRDLIRGDVEDDPILIAPMLSRYGYGNGHASSSWGYSSIIAASLQPPPGNGSTNAPEKITGSVKNHASERGRSGKEEGSLTSPQCHRNDGKLWRCSNPALAGSIYCDHHHHQKRQKKDKKKKKKRKGETLPSNGGFGEDGGEIKQVNANQDANVQGHGHGGGGSSSSRDAKGLKHGHMPRSEVKRERYGAQDGDAGSREASSSSSSSLSSSSSSSLVVLPGSNPDMQSFERCHRKDGKKWQCSMPCKPGFRYCEHHHGNLRRPVRKKQGCPDDG